MERTELFPDARDVIVRMTAGCDANALARQLGFAGCHNPLFLTPEELIDDLQDAECARVFSQDEHSVMIVWVNHEGMFSTSMSKAQLDGHEERLQFLADVDPHTFSSSHRVSELPDDEFLEGSVGNFHERETAVVGSLKKDIVGIG